MITNGVMTATLSFISDIKWLKPEINTNTTQTQLGAAIAAICHPFIFFIFGRFSFSVYDFIEFVMNIKDYLL